MGKSLPVNRCLVKGQKIDFIASLLIMASHLPRILLLVADPQGTQKKGCDAAATILTLPGLTTARDPQICLALEIKQLASFSGYAMTHKAWLQALLDRNYIWWQYFDRSSIFGVFSLSNLLINKDQAFVNSKIKCIVYLQHLL